MTKCHRPHTCDRGKTAKGADSIDELKGFQLAPAHAVDTNDASPGTCRTNTGDGKPMEGIEAGTASKRTKASRPAIASRASLKRPAPTPETDGNAVHDLATRARKTERFACMRVGAEVVIYKNQRAGHHDVTGKKAHVQNKRAVIVALAVWPSTWLSVKTNETVEMVKVRTGNVILATEPRRSPPTPETEGSLPVQQESQLGNDDGVQLEVPTEDCVRPTPERVVTNDAKVVTAQPDKAARQVAKDIADVSPASPSWSQSPPADWEPPCTVCKRIDLEEGVLCDGCDASYHMHCLNPPVKSAASLPPGDWLCPKCAVSETGRKRTRPAAKAQPVKATRQVAKDIADVSPASPSPSPSRSQSPPADWEPPCTVCKRIDLEEGVLCDGCDVSYHLHCLNPPVKSAASLPPGDWLCPKCAVTEHPTGYIGLLPAVISETGSKNRQAACQACPPLNKHRPYICSAGAKKAAVEDIVADIHRAILQQPESAAAKKAARLERVESQCLKEYAAAEAAETAAAAKLEKERNGAGAAAEEQRLQTVANAKDDFRIAAAKLEAVAQAKSAEDLRIAAEQAVAEQAVAFPNAKAEEDESTTTNLKAKQVRADAGAEAGQKAEVVSRTKAVEEERVATEKKAAGNAKVAEQEKTAKATKEKAAAEAKIVRVEPQQKAYVSSPLAFVNSHPSSQHLQNLQIHPPAQEEE